MTRQEYQNAMDRLEPDVYMKRRIAARIGREGQRRRPVRRVVAGALAAAAVLACTMGVAMAASPEFRQTVLSFFRLEEAEQVPGHEDIVKASPGQPSVTQAILGGQVRVQYLKLEGGGWQEWGGLLGQFDGGLLRNDQFYTIDDSGLVEVETQLAEIAAVWDGVEFQLSLSWARTDDRVVCYGSGASVDGTHTAGMTAIPGRTDVVELGWTCVEADEIRSYRMLYDLDTGEIVDVYAPFDRELVELAGEKWLASNLKHAIIRDDEACYLADLEAGTLTELSRLIGWEVEPGTNVCFGDDHTLVITRWDRMEGVVNSWVYDLNSGTLIQTVDGEDLSLYWGSFGRSAQGWLYGLDICEDGSVTVVDLRTGTRTPVEGFTCAGEGRFEINADANKLLYEVSEFGESHQGFLGISQLGVLDLEKGVFLAFDRKGYEGNQERRVAWLDNDRVALWSGQWGAEAEYYLCVYEF